MIPIAPSSDHSPGPTVATEMAIVAMIITNSKPLSRMKKWCRCSTQPATHIVPTTARAANGVSKPSASNSPPNVSQDAAIVALKRPGRMPIESNQPATPPRLPRNLLSPCSASVTPATTRRMAIPRSTSYIVASLPRD